MRAALCLVLLIAGCGRPAGEQAAGDALEAAAIRAGIVRDPGKRDLTGLYARDTDRLCLVRRGERYRIGAISEFGGGQGCSAAGEAELIGDRLDVAFGDACRFEARLVGEAIVFPGQLPTACARACSDRASLSAVEVDLQSEVPGEAMALRDRNGRQPCGS